jgi:hypothetical protein
MPERGTSIIEPLEGTSSERGVKKHREFTGLRGKLDTERLAALDEQVARISLMDSWTDDQIQELSKDLAAMPELKNYKHETVISDTLNQLINEAKSIAASENNAEAATKADLAEHLLFEFMADIEKYVRLVISIRKFKQTQSLRLEHEDYLQLMESQDRNREIAHSAIMSDVLPLSRMLNANFPKSLSQPAAEKWESFIRPRWFSPSQIKDRDFMKNWARNTYAFKKASILRAKIDEVKRARQEQTN